MTKLIVLNREFAEANGFRLLPEDNVATNPAITFRVATFMPTDDFKPAKPFQTRLTSQSKLLLTKPETVIAIAAGRSRTQHRAQGAATPSVPCVPPAGRAARKR